MRLSGEDILKLIDICDTALFLLDKKKVVSFDTFNHGGITISEGIDFVDEIFQRVETP